MQTGSWVIQVTCHWWSVRGHGPLQLQRPRWQCPALPLLMRNARGGVSPLKGIRDGNVTQQMRKYEDKLHKDRELNKSHWFYSFIKPLLKVPLTSALAMHQTSVSSCCSSQCINTPESSTYRGRLATLFPNQSRNYLNSSLHLVSNRLKVGSTCVSKT